MSDSYDDLDNIDIEETYCKKHRGLWPHECGCDKKKKKDSDKLPDMWIVEKERNKFIANLSRWNSSYGNPIRYVPASELSAAMTKIDSLQSSNKQFLKMQSRMAKDTNYLSTEVVDLKEKLSAALAKVERYRKALEEIEKELGAITYTHSIGIEFEKIRSAPIPDTKGVGATYIPKASLQLSRAYSKANNALQEPDDNQAGENV